MGAPLFVSFVYKDEQSDDYKANDAAFDWPSVRTWEDVQALRQHLFERLELPAGAELVLSSWRRLEG